MTAERNEHAGFGAPPADVLANQTYVHLAARACVRPLVGTRVRPNHLTVLRLAIGLVAVACLIPATTVFTIWSGILWTVACFLDRADGELARLADLRSVGGQRLDYFSDLILDAAWFLCVGIGARHGMLGDLAVVLGVVCCVSMVIVQWAGEMYERLSPPGVKVWAGVERFHPDDALFLLALFTWVGVLTPVLVGASAVIPVVAVVTALRYRALRRRSLAVAAVA